MKYFLYFLVFVGLSAPISAQILEPVKWNMTHKALGNDEFELVFTANMEPKWSIYSQHTSDDGPVPTSFQFEAGGHYTRIGAVAERGDKKEGMDPLFGVNVIKFTHGPVVFTQKIKVKDYTKPVKGFLEFMTCDDERCLPPTEVDFSFTLAPASPASGNNEQVDPKTATPTTTDAVDTGTLAQASGMEVKSASNGLLQPVLWKLDVEQTAPTTYKLTFNAHMDAGWSIYSAKTEEGGPVPTTFTFNGEGVKAQGSTRELAKPKMARDPLFDNIMVGKFSQSPVGFEQIVNVAANSTVIEGFIDYMACDDSQCTPLGTPFKVMLNPLSVQIGEQPQPSTGAAAESAAGLDNNVFVWQKAVTDLPPVGQCSEEVTVQGKSIWAIFGLGFIGGLIALVLPCIWPMIPLTVSYFTKTAETRAKGITNASMYGFFILLVYVLLSIPFHLMDSLDPDILNKIATNVPLNIFFFFIFIVFAFSFFGYYELALPEKWLNKSSQNESKGGMVGIFFMALTLALVSFSCTGPILGSLLVGALSSSGGAIQLTAGMAGFGLALALPFGLFAAFPAMLKTLPKSGGWLNSVKVVLGFMELALAFKFLSNADLVDHWEFLKIELFLAVWILAALGIVLYLTGVIKFPHDDAGRVKFSPVRIGFVALFAASVIYLVSGFQVDEEKGTYKPLVALSGLVPPVCYSFFRPCDCPQQLDCFKELEEGIAFAKANNKPIMVDFTGHACQNCRKMEENVWPKPAVYTQLKNDYVVISLYVDDKTPLPQPITVTTVNGRERTLDEVGELWSHFQQTYFNANAQPQYVLMSPDGYRLNATKAYTPDVDEYADFLRCGLENYRRLTEQQKREGKLMGMQ